MIQKTLAVIGATIVCGLVLFVGVLIIMIIMATNAKSQTIYVNPFAGAMLLDQTVTVNGVKLVDLGGDQYLGGVRVGAMTNQTGLLYGAELEGFAAGGRARAVVNGVPYTYQVNGAVGLYGMIGWQTQERAIGFLRAGPQYTFTNQGNDILALVGVGAIVPISELWSFRMDLDYAWGNNVEHYRGTLGLLWRF